MRIIRFYWSLILIFYTIISFAQKPKPKNIEPTIRSLQELRARLVTKMQVGQDPRFAEMIKEFNYYGYDTYTQGSKIATMISDFDRDKECQKIIFRWICQKYSGDYFGIRSYLENTYYMDRDDAISIAKFIADVIKSDLNTLSKSTTLSKSEAAESTKIIDTTQLPAWRLKINIKHRDSSNEKGDILYLIKVDEFGDLYSIVPIESTVSKDVEKYYRQQIEENWAVERIKEIKEVPVTSLIKYKLSIK